MVSKSNKKVKASKSLKKPSNISAMKLKAIADKQTKSEILSHVAEKTNLAKKEIAEVFKVLSATIIAHMAKRGSGEFTIPETGIRIKRKTRPATKKRLGRNPATGEQIWISAKPARTVVKILPLRLLKDAVMQ